MSSILGLAGFVLCTLLFWIIGAKECGKGLDGSWSFSNLQLILWTGAVLGSYLGTCIVKGGFVGDISGNLLALMGVSASSAVGARGIRARQQHIPRLVRPARTGGLLSEERDPRKLSVVKLQVMAWTLVALGIYVTLAAGNIWHGVHELPDVGSGLLVLMGVSHGAYVANKAADSPRRW